MITAQQIREARELIGWDADALSYRARISTPTVYKAEREGIAHLRPVNVIKIRRALEAAGIEFITKEGGESGVRLKPAP